MPNCERMHQPSMGKEECNSMVLTDTVLHPEAQTSSMVLTDTAYRVGIANI